jgi:acetyl esterase
MKAQVYRDELAAGLRVSALTVPGPGGTVPLRRYESSAHPVGLPLLWVHGGAFVSGGLDQLESHAVACALARTGRVIYTVDYRLVKMGLKSVLTSMSDRPLPGVRFPLPLDDVLAAFTFVRDNAHGGRAFLGGASAGACLSAAAAVRMRDINQPPASGLVLAYGIFHPALPPQSAQLRSRTRGLRSLVQFTPGRTATMTRNYAGTPQALQNPHAFPGGHDLHGLPSTLILNADHDTLRASGELFAAELVTAGVPVEEAVIDGSWHGFLNRPREPHFPRAISRIDAWLAAADHEL